jgi:hypothetical protein
MRNLLKRLKVSTVFAMMAALFLLQLAPFMTTPASALMRYYTNVDSNDFPGSLKSALGSQTHWDEGFIDVTKAPYNAIVNDGIDDTDEIQEAINDGYDNNLVVFFPAGTYNVSKQLVLNQIDDHWFHPGSNWYSQRKFGHILVGSTTGANRPVIKLKDNSTVQDNMLFLFQYYTPPGTAPSPPNPGIRHRDLTTWYDPVNGTTNPGRHYVSLMRGIDIDMGNNSAVNAISMNSAEHTGLENISISGTAFNAGIYRIPGSGGGIVNVKVTGGSIGIYQDQYHRIRPSPGLNWLVKAIMGSNS